MIHLDINIHKHNTHIQAELDTFIHRHKTAKFVAAFYGHAQNCDACIPHRYSQSVWAISLGTQYTYVHNHMYTPLVFNRSTPQFAHQ